MYLMIENLNEAPIESFTVFGASTSRGEESSIGQFGSGAKFGTLVCMRFGLNPIIYSGRDRIEFFSEPMTMKGRSFSRVCYKYKTKTEKTSYTLEFGALDWDDPAMGLREFVSNAIDGANGIVENVNVNIVENPRAKSGYTRVFVPLTPEVQKFYSSLSARFLHFNPGRGGGEVRGVLGKVKNGGAEIFLKGVLVREVEEESLFDYNFGDELRIDESRNMSDYTVRTAAESALAKTSSETVIEKVFNALSSNKKCWEGSFGSYSLRGAIYNNTLWKETFKKIYGENAVIFSDTQAIIAEHARNKGFKPVCIFGNGWYDALQRAGIQTIINVMDDVNDNGHIVRDASAELIKTAKRVWGWLETLDLTKNKPFPEVKEYTAHMDGGSMVLGYYKNKTVFIEKSNINNTQTMLEEMAHYITGSTDNSRDFQDFAFKFGASLGELIG